MLFRAQIQLDKTLTFGPYDPHKTMLVCNDFLDYHDRDRRCSTRSMASIVIPEGDKNTKQPSGLWNVEKAFGTDQQPTKPRRRL